MENLKPILYYAAEGSSGEFEVCVKKAEKDGKNWLDEKDEKGRNALFHSAMTDNIKNFQFIIKRAAIRPDTIIQILDKTNATVLHWATQYASAKVVKEIISMFLNDRPGKIILAKDNDSVTPLHIAATKSNIKVLKLFIDNLTVGDNVYQIAQDKKSRSPLHYAACKVNIEAIRLMIDSDIAQPDSPVLGFPIDQRDRNGIIPLMCAVGVNLPQALPVIKLLAKKKPVSKTRQNKDGMTVLHIAVAARNLNAVQLLVEELDCSVDLVDNEQRTPLHYAAEHAYPEIVQYLLNHGARNSTRDKLGVTPAHYAAQFSADCLRIILTESRISEVKDNEGRSCLMWAVCAGNIDVIHYLIQREDAPDRRAVDKYGYTALHLAAMVGNEKVCKILINQGWNISERDNQSITALHLAAGRGHTDVLRCLVTSGANMSDRDSLDRTPVFWACLGGQSHTLHCMIKELSFEWRTSGGSETKPIIDALGRTPLHAAAYAGFSACINVMLNIEQEDNFLKSPLVGWRDQDGKTALHEACIAGKIDCVLSLLKGGSAINAIDYDEKTPLDCAIQFKHKMISDHLKSLDALTFMELRDTAAREIQRFYRKYKSRKSKFTCI
ncbi:unnamed protein product [Caenorhabditis angaria]|uniref:ANK_REP_REGION domain-containing protein n=1 Tax=Caenorhabditis angaria TaxID=860376 RepID=A0A9P1IUB9_9PELO|nr:unnamed protein product [Caenorhabditis angaria]